MAERSRNSIADSVASPSDHSLSFNQALESPCQSCETVPCCAYLPLHTFKITNMIELDHALYVSNFDHILLGLAANGDWSIYYVYPCRYLDKDGLSCQVHDLPEQPAICRHYNPYNCWYKRVLTQTVSEEFLQIDRARMQYIVSKLVFDEARNIIEVPDWASLVQDLATIPSAPFSSGSNPPVGDPIFDQWQASVIHQQAAVPAPKVDVDVFEPCTGCDAPCCKTLVFPQGLPTTATKLDFYRFSLGFPGIELGIADGEWAVVVKTTCRHLKDNRCSLYGMAERPLICKYYDALKCTYRVNFGLPRPAGYLRVRLEQLDWLQECYSFDQEGTISQYPKVELIREHIEKRWAESFQQAKKNSNPMVSGEEQGAIHKESLNDPVAAGNKESA